MQSTRFIGRLSFTTVCLPPTGKQEFCLTLCLPPVANKQSAVEPPIQKRLFSRAFRSGCKAPVLLGGSASLSFACRLWQTSKAQLRHRSRKGFSASRSLAYIKLRRNKCIQCLLLAKTWAQLAAPLYHVRLSSYRNDRIHP